MEDGSGIKHMPEALSTKIKKQRKNMRDIWNIAEYYNQMQLGYQSGETMENVMSKF